MKHEFCRRKQPSESEPNIQTGTTAGPEETKIREHQPTTDSGEEGYMGQGLSVSDLQMRTGTVTDQDTEKFWAKGSLVNY